MPCKQWLSILFFLLVLLSGSANGEMVQTAPGCELPLQLPADKVLRISATEVEFEHHGILPINDKATVYHHWETEYWSVPLAAVLVGFEEVAVTLLAGEIIHFDVYDPLYIRTMQVAISTGDFASIEHQELRIAPTSKLYVEEKGSGRGFVLEKGEEILVKSEAGRFKVLDNKGNLWEFGPRLYLWPDSGGLIQINSFQRGTGTRFYPQYRGRFELSAQVPEGFLVINEVSLEEYLYQVVPSEMPISWHLEALKAQAVAARTFAVAQVIYSRQGHLGFHVTDSTNSQVYNNQPEATSTTKAIEATAGKILVKGDNTIGSTYYYSTSPRLPLTDLNTWQQSKDHALEGNSPWYRWQCTFEAHELSRIFPELGEITAINILERDHGGRVVELSVKGSAGEVVLNGELRIRSALRPGMVKRVSDTLKGPVILPSAFFFLDSKYNQAGALESITFYGGGSGHGQGMSQWGAKGMAEAGYDYLAILEKYYPETRLITHSEQLRY